MKRLNRFWCILAWLLAAVAAYGQSVFDMPRLFPQHKRTLAQFVEALGRGDLLAAESAARTTHSARTTHASGKNHSPPRSTNATPITHKVRFTFI